jgi:hypothetical protein
MLPPSPNWSGQPTSRSGPLGVFLLGPSLLYRPTRNLYLGVRPLFGLTRESPTVEAYFLLGIDFEPFSHGYSKTEDSGDESRFPRLRRPW